MYDGHLSLIEKRVVNFLLVLIKLFSLGVTAEALRANIGSKSTVCVCVCVCVCECRHYQRVVVLPSAHQHWSFVNRSTTRNW